MLKKKNKQLLRRVINRIQCIREVQTSMDWEVTIGWAAGRTSNAENSLCRLLLAGATRLRWIGDIPSFTASWFFPQKLYLSLHSPGPESHSRESVWDIPVGRRRPLLSRRAVW